VSMTTIRRGGWSPGGTHSVHSAPMTDTGDFRGMGTHGLELPAETRFGSLRTGLASLRPRAWLIFLIVGLGLASAGALIGDEDVLPPSLAVLGLSGPAAILAGIQIYQPSRRWPWQLVAICVAATTIGIGVI